MKQRRSSGSKANRKSELIVNKIKNQKLNEIYQCLDTSKRGFLTYKGMSLSNFDDKLLEILKPLFITIKNSDQLIDHEKYMILAQKLYQILPQSEKNLILKFGKEVGPKDHNLVTCTFSPKINRSKSPNASKYIQSTIFSPKSTQGSGSQMFSPKSFVFPEEKSLMKKISTMKTDEDVSKNVYKGSFMSNTMKNYLDA
jgi:hypothetical protein